MPALNRNEKVNCEDCGQECRRADNARHRKRCEKQKEHKCPNCHFYTKSKEMGYHVAKKHAQPSSKQSTVCPSCEQEFPSYYSLQQHRRKEHGAKQRKPSDTVADLNKIVEEEGEDGEKLKEELSACQHFLVDTEMENGRHKVFNFQMSKLDTKIINEKLEEPYKDHLCLFCALAMNMNGHNDLDSHTSRYFTDFISKSGYDPKSFRGVSVEDLPAVEEIVQRNIFIYDFDIQDGEHVGELARRSIGRFDKTVKLLRFNNHIIDANDIDSFFKCFRCPSCDTFFNKSDNFNKHLLRCKDRVKHIYPKNVYELRETLFGKLEGFSLPVSEDNKLFNNLAIFDFESICVPTEELKETKTTTWIGKHVPISVSISSNLIDDTIFLYNKDPQNLIIDFVSNLELFAEKSKVEMRTKFQDIEVAVNERMRKIFDQLNERGKKFSSNKFEYEDE